VSVNTVSRDYDRYRSHLAKLPSQSLEDAVGIRDYLFVNVSTDTARRCLTNFSACCDWAVTSKLIDSIPFQAWQETLKLRSQAGMITTPLYLQLSQNAPKIAASNENRPEPKTAIVINIKQYINAFSQLGGSPFPFGPSYCPVGIR